MIRYLARRLASSPLLVALTVLDRARLVRPRAPRRRGDDDARAAGDARAGRPRSARRWVSTSRSRSRSAASCSNAVQGDLGEDFFTRRPVTDIVIDALAAHDRPRLLVDAAGDAAGDPARRAGGHPARLAARPRARDGVDRRHRHPVARRRARAAGRVRRAARAVPDHRHRLVLRSARLPPPPGAADASRWRWRGSATSPACCAPASSRSSARPYIRAATAYGLRSRMIFFRYALKNAFIPTLAVVGFGVATLMAGALFVEVIFSRKGVGIGPRRTPSRPGTTSSCRASSRSSPCCSSSSTCSSISPTGSSIRGCASRRRSSSCEAARSGCANWGRAVRARA